MNKEDAMANLAEKSDHPHIISQPDLCGGSAVIRGTKFPVRSAVNYVLRHGLSPEELVKEFTHLSLAQIYDALSYYYDHKDSVDNDLRVNSTDSTPDSSN